MKTLFQLSDIFTRSEMAIARGGVAADIKEDAIAEIVDGENIHEVATNPYQTIFLNYLIAEDNIAAYNYGCVTVAQLLDARLNLTLI